MPNVHPYVGRLAGVTIALLFAFVAGTLGGAAVSAAAIQVPTPASPDTPASAAALQARVTSGAKAHDGIRTAPDSYRPGDFTRSMVYSGAFTLVVSLAGLMLVTRRRRQW